MRVYAPRHTLGWISRVNRKDIWLGVPLDGDWVDVPDFFIQATRNQDVNDVVHAKVVDPFEFAYTQEDQFVTYGSRTAIWPQTLSPSPLNERAGNETFHICRAAFELVSSKEDISLRYKGKRKVPSKIVEIKSRVLHPWCAQIQIDVRSRRIATGKYITYPVSVIIQWWVPKDTSTTNTVLYSRTQSCRYNLQGDIISGFWLSKTLEDETIRSLGTDEAELYLSDSTRIADARRSALRSVVNACMREVTELDALARQGRTTSGQVAVCGRDPIPELPLESGFMFNEPDTVGRRIDPILLGAHGGLNEYWRNLMCQHALRSAFESLPRLSDNSIQNLIEIVSFIKALVVDRKIEIPHSLSDAWLSYRYQYSTGKMDVQDAIKFVSRHRALGSLDRSLVGRGTYSRTFEDGTDVLCRAQVEVSPKNLDVVGKIWRALDQYGLTPDFYVIWDSIPYSFMVDWFLPISDIASNLDADRMYLSGEYYTFKSLTYSFTYFKDIGSYRAKYYTRWLGSMPSSFNSLYWLDAPSGTSRTWGKRVLDASSIFIGGI